MILFFLSLFNFINNNKFDNYLNKVKLHWIKSKFNQIKILKKNKQIKAHKKYDKKIIMKQKFKQT